MADVVFENVSKIYGRVPVVRNLDLQIKEGEFFVLLGPSGCGKTTSLHIVAGFVHPNTGDIRIGGQSVVSLPPRKRQIGMVFQDYSLFPTMTVAENIGFALVERRVGRSEIERRVNELLELIRLPGLGARFPDQLSGGQQQRVAIARAMAFTPRVLLMDEPFGALDVKLRETMQVEIVRIQRALGVTTIFVTHDQDEAMRLADRILIMRDGLVEQLGTPEQLYACPATPFVAGFLGKVNLLAGTIIGQVGEAVRLKLATGETVLAQGAPEMPRSSAIILAIRPENLHFHCDLQGQQNRISGVIESRRFLGSWIAYSVSTRHGTTLQVMRPAGEKQWNVGEPVELVFDLRNATVFPSAHSP